MTDGRGIPGQSKAAEAEWLSPHRDKWERKRGLRSFYEDECFARIVDAMAPGRSLELGAGPGFFTRYHRCSVVSDVTAADHVDQIVDAHDMPFDDGTFSTVVAMDVVHHFRDPSRALGEIARVLQPGGRLVLVEPWTGSAGWFVNTYLHDEDCFVIDDPWAPVFQGDKDPMDGNATIAKTYFFEKRSELAERTGLVVRTLEPFSFLGYLATGGFTRWQLPLPLVKGLLTVDRNLPGPLRRACSLKVFIVAERR